MTSKESGSWSVNIISWPH